MILHTSIRTVLYSKHWWAKQAMTMYGISHGSIFMMKCSGKMSLTSCLSLPLPRFPPGVLKPEADSGAQLSGPNEALRAAACEHAGNTGRGRDSAWAPTVMTAATKHWCRAGGYGEVREWRHSPGVESTGYSSHIWCGWQSGKCRGWKSSKCFLFQG